MKKKIIKVTLTSAIFIGSLGIFTTSPANASIIDPFDFTNSNAWNFISIVAQKLGIRQSIINDIRAGFNELDNLLGFDTATIILNETGELGQIDIEAVERAIETADINSTNQGVQKSILKTLVTAKVAEGYSNSVFSKDSQIKNAEEQQKMGQAVEEVSILESQANNEIITQNVMKKIAAQNAQLAAISGSIYSSTEELKTGLAINSRLSSKAIENQLKEQSEKASLTQKEISQELMMFSLFSNLN